MSSNDKTETVASQQDARDNDTNITRMKVILIRHGESEAQTARLSGMSRSNPLLRDCGITSKGRSQANKLRESWIGPQPDLIVVSPLKRALETAYICFPPDSLFIINPSIAEVGSKVPENNPRSLGELEKDNALAFHTAWVRINLNFLLDFDFPESQ